MPVAPRGTVKSRIRSVAVPLFTTAAELPGAPVVVVPTATVGGTAGSPAPPAIGCHASPSHQYSAPETSWTVPHEAVAGRSPTASTGLRQWRSPKRPGPGCAKAGAAASASKRAVLSDDAADITRKASPGRQGGARTELPAPPRPRRRSSKSAARRDCLRTNGAGIFCRESGLTDTRAQKAEDRLSPCLLPGLQEPRQ